VAPPSRPGRGFVIAGSILVALSVVVGVAGTALTVGRFDAGQFQRDVVVDGPESALLPGELRFTVAEPLDQGRDASMTVGVAVSPPSAGDPDCELRSDSGDQVPLEAPIAGTEFLRQGREEVRMIRQAEVGPGGYTLTCATTGEPGAGRGGSVRVGRVFGTDDALGLIGPALGFLAAVAVSVVSFLVGVVLLVIGLVRGRRTADPIPPSSWPQR
jgi:hypothetical protein